MKELLTILLIVGILISCDDGTDDGMLGDCQFSTEIDKADYDKTATNNYFIDNAMIMGDCLEISISSSGCDGKSWEFDLFDSGDIAESFPPQRFLRLKLENQELCQAQISITKSFNLEPLQTDDGIIHFNLDGWPDFLVYDY